MTRVAPSELEMECVRVLWRVPSASVSQVRQKLGRPLAYTTVQTLLDRLVAKGVAARRKQGRSYAYTAALDRETARATAVARLLRLFFDNDAEALTRYLQAQPPARARAAAASSAMDDILL